MRSLLLTLALIPTLTLSAWSLPCRCDTFEGLYAGAAIDPTTNMASQDIVSSGLITTIFGTDTTRDFSTADLYDTRLWGELYTGYGLRFCNWIYLGGRFGINFSSFGVGSQSIGAHEDIFDDSFISTLRNQTNHKLWSVEYTLDFKPGIVWCDRTMIFGIIGAAFNQGTLRGDAFAQYTPTNAPQTQASSS